MDNLFGLLGSIVEAVTDVGGERVIEAAADLTGERSPEDRIEYERVLTRPRDPSVNDR